MAKKIYIDGDSGTTGLEIVARLKGRADLEVLAVDPKHRKDPEYKRELAAQADLVILCLPDPAAEEAVVLYQEIEGKLLDASSAHRVMEGWVYGLPELGFREAIKTAKQVSNPGCYPTGFLLAVRPLVKAGVILPNQPLTVNAISGYSGGGRKLISTYQNQPQPDQAIRLYGLSQTHKHLPEMTKYSGLDGPPVFVPSVGDFAQGMLVSIPLHSATLSADVGQLSEIWQDCYQNEPFITVVEKPENLLEQGFLSPTTLVGTNQVELFAFVSRSQAVLVARLDNLGKGASGAAVQNLNLMLGLDETTGLV